MLTSSIESTVMKLAGPMNRCVGREGSTRASAWVLNLSMKNREEYIELSKNYYN